MGTSMGVINDKPFSTTPRHRRQPRHFSPNPSRWHPVLLSPSCPPMTLPAARLTLCQRSSPRLSARISFRPSTPEWPRTRDSHTPSVRRLVTKPLLSPGELVVLLPVFPVSLEEEPTVLDRLLSVTCADLVACSHQPRSGESGTKRSTSDKSDTPLLLPWLLHPSQLSFWPVVTKFPPSLRFLWSSTPRSSPLEPLPAHLPPSVSCSQLAPPQTLPRSRTPASSAQERVSSVAAVTVNAVDLSLSTTLRLMERSSPSLSATSPVLRLPPSSPLPSSSSHQAATSDASSSGPPPPSRPSIPSTDPPPPHPTCRRISSSHPQSSNKQISAVSSTPPSCNPLSAPPSVKHAPSRSVLPRLLSLLFSRRIRFLVFACSSVRRGRLCFFLS